MECWHFKGNWDVVCSIRNYRLECNLSMNWWLILAYVMFRVIHISLWAFILFRCRDWGSCSSFSTSGCSSRSPSDSPCSTPASSWLPPWWFVDGHWTHSACTSPCSASRYATAIEHLIKNCRWKTVTLGKDESGHSIEMAIMRRKKCNVTPVAF